MAERRRGSGVRGTRPRFVVCVGAPLLAAVRNKLTVAGWHVHDGLDVTDHVEATTCGAGDPLICLGHLASESDLIVVSDLLVRGISLGVSCEDRLAQLAYDDGRRLADAEWYDDERPPLSVGLEPVHLELLLRVRAGDAVVAAAAGCNMSPRTAARRLAEARARVRARTTGEAAVRVGARVDALAP